MAKEFFDRVDENDKVIGVTTKKEAHEEGYIHRVVAVFVFDKERKLLVQLRSKKKDGLLDHSVGGHVKKGETYTRASIRELYEELGLIRKKLRKVGKVFYNHERHPHYFGVYEMKLKKGEKIKQLKREMDDVIPMTLSEIANRMRKNPEIFTFGFINTFNLYIKHKKLNISKIKI